MSPVAFRLGLRYCPVRAMTLTSTLASQSSISTLPATRHFSSIASRLATQTALSGRSSCFTSSIQSSRWSQTRQASNAAAEAIRANPNQPPRNTVLDWNTFFGLRTSRRRYSLASSILCSIVVTGGAFVFLSTQPEMTDEITRLLPLDPVISMGLLTFAATFLGWLIGPIFGNTIWKLFHRSRLPEFTVKERAFFERIKRHRVNPMGASTNNPVPDYYGEKIGSVSGYRRWLKDQRAFNRKREGSYPAGI